ncbi:O-fucosyltransferase 29 [Orobanche gracilis]
MGHKRTIRPNAKRLSALFAARDKMEWSTFSRKVKSCQRGFMGEPDEMRPGRGEFHEYPSACICQKPSKYLDVDENRILDRSPNVTAEGSSHEYNVSEEVKREKRSTRNKTVSAVEEMYRDEVLSFD